MAGLDDLGTQAERFLNDGKVQAALHSEQAEDLSDAVLDGLESLAGSVTGGRFEQQLADARDAADKSIGTE